MFDFLGLGLGLLELLPLLALLASKVLASKASDVKKSASKVSETALDAEEEAALVRTFGFLYTGKGFKSSNEDSEEEESQQMI